jgi:uncharacterized protein with GYD domain
MAKYLYRANLTEKGLEGTLKEGGSARREAVKKAVESLGGTLEVFYYAFGEQDVVAIADLPDNVSAAAFSLVVTAAGGAVVSTQVLLAPEEIDQVTSMTAAYRAPGG